MNLPREIRARAANTTLPVQSDMLVTRPATAIPSLGFSPVCVRTLVSPILRASLRMSSNKIIKSLHVEVYTCFRLSPCIFREGLSSSSLPVFAFIRDYSALHL